MNELPFSRYGLFKSQQEIEAEKKHLEKVRENFYNYTLKTFYPSEWARLQAEKLEKEKPKVVYPKTQRPMPLEGRGKKESS